MDNRLEIICIYRSDEGREVEYSLLDNGQDAMDINDYELKKFWQTMGGISITRDKYCNIFYSTNFYNISKIVSFLVQSLYWIKGRTALEFDSDDEYPDDVIVRTMNKEILKLSRADQDNISLSFKPEVKEKSWQRGDRYFNLELFDVQEWTVEVNKALNEYFSILSRLTDSTKETDIQLMARKYIQLWNEIASC